MRYNNIEKVLSADMTMMTFIDSVGNLLTSLGNQIPPQMLYAFAISCIVLFISTIIKYGLGVSLNDMKKMQMLLELSIDVCAVIATIIASMETSKPYSLVLFMSFSSIIPILIGSIAYLLKPKKRIRILMPITIIMTLTCVVNAIYYENYVSSKKKK